MKIRRIVLTNFMAYDSEQVELPDRGVVVVTGKNGEGKSSLTEAIAVAHYGRTMRGIPYWRDGVACRVRVESDVATVTRTVSENARGALEWSPAGGEGETYATATKAQAALAPLLPSYEVWRRAALFTSADAALFSQATDAERKSFLEQVLGLGRFDEAYARCRADLRAVTDKESAIAVRRSRAIAIHEERARAQAAVVREVGLDPSELYFRWRRAQADAAEWMKEITRLTRELAASESECNLLGRSLRAVEEEAERFASGACPLCEQPIPEARRAAIAAHVAEEVARCERQYARERAFESTVRPILARLRTESEANAKRARAAELALVAAETEVARLAAQQAQMTAAAEALASAAQELQLVETEFAAVKLERVTLETCAKVLGLRGVRAQVLGETLGGLEALTNLRLETLFPGKRIELRPYTEKKGGDVTDVISLRVYGVASGRGYEGSSTGQRRRIDLALLLGLAEIADAASGREPGTIFFDEAFDALDDEGVEAASQLIAELGTTRPVVVISHRVELVEQLLAHAVLHLHVEGYQIRSAPHLVAA